MKAPKWLMILGLASPGLLFSAQRASMEAPVVRGAPGEVSVSARFSQFVSGSEYRVGVGASGDLAGLTISLDQDGTAVSGDLTSFDQPQSWWSEAGQLKAKGFLLQDSKLPAAGETLSMKVTIPRASADAAGAFFIFVAKRYGRNTWYLEDGAEINESHW